MPWRTRPRTARPRRFRGSRRPSSGARHAQILPFRPRKRKNGGSLALVVAVILALAAGSTALGLAPEQVGQALADFAGRLDHQPQADITGVASVTDGDTIRIGSERIRLHGIDAPERDQACFDGTGRPWRCGRHASRELQTLIGGQSVSCHQEDVDRYGRIVARCLAGGRDMAEQLVLQGLALAYRRYSRTYVTAEHQARLAGRGMWAGDFDPPWDWRRRQAAG